MSATIEYLRTFRRAGFGVEWYVHAVVSGSGEAACGARPASGWSPQRNDTVTCPRCRKRLGMGPLPAPRAEGGAR